MAKVSDGMASANTAESARRLVDVQSAIDEALRVRTEFTKDCPARLGESIRYSLLAPGKRLRPIMVVFAAEACGGTLERAIPAACAVEMVHCYSLIHDDLPAMDDDDLRRGRPTCHRQYDEATAILAGDALLALAFEVLAKEISPPRTAARCCAVLAAAAGPQALVGGQADDLVAPPDADLETLRGIHRRKTGAMFLASLHLGGLVADAAPHQLKMLQDFGENIGLAFQIVDDLLDVAGKEDRVGKRLRKDAAKGKLTYPGLMGAEASRRHAAELIARAAAALDVLGPEGDGLRTVARFVLERSH